MNLSMGNKSRRKIIIRILLVSAIAGIALWTWEQVLEDRLIPKKWGAIERGKIYRSGRLSSALVKKMLKKHNIKVIISLSAETPGNEDQEAEKKAAAALGIQLYRFPLRGNGTGDINNYAQAIATMVNAKKRGKLVLVHCAAGSQRTGGVTAFYRVLVEKKHPSFAYKELMQYGWDPKDNQALLPYINSNMNKLAAKLKEMGVIDDIPNPLPVLGP